jgi:hypothetical protein
MLRVISPAELQMSDRSRSAAAVLRIGWAQHWQIILVMTMPVLNLKILREELEAHLTAEKKTNSSEHGRRGCREDHLPPEEEETARWMCRTHTKPSQKAPSLGRSTT